MKKILLITFLLIFFTAHSQNRKDSFLKRLFCCCLKQKENGHLVNVLEDTKNFEQTSPSQAKQAHTAESFTITFERTRGKSSIAVSVPARNGAEEIPMPLLSEAIDWELTQAIEHSLDSVKCD
ncbi:MAG: hypothetical protein LVQ75_00105 [Candidatus Babeliales bacterium]